jgi:hypothetical protein
LCARRDRTTPGKPEQTAIGIPKKTDGSTGTLSPPCHK